MIRVEIVGEEEEVIGGVVRVRLVMLERGGR